MVAPVDAREERHEPRLVVVLLLERALLHAEGVADVVELELLAVLLPHALLDELVPVVDGEGPRRDDELVPQRLDVIVGRLLREVQAVELQSERERGVSVRELKCGAVNCTAPNQHWHYTCALLPSPS